jgi:hypothetical protein
VEVAGHESRIRLDPSSVVVLSMSTSGEYLKAGRERGGSARQGSTGRHELPRFISHHDGAILLLL